MLINGEDSLTKGEPYLEHIDSKEIKKLVHRLYQDQPDRFENRDTDDAVMNNKSKRAKSTIAQALNQDTDSHDHIASEIDKLLKDSTTLDQHAESAEPSHAPLPEFPATEKPKKIEKPKHHEKKRGFLGFLKK